MAAVCGFITVWNNVVLVSIPKIKNKFKLKSLDISTYYIMIPI